MTEFQTGVMVGIVIGFFSAIWVVCMCVAAKETPEERRANEENSRKLSTNNGRTVMPQKKAAERR